MSVPAGRRSKSRERLLYLPIGFHVLLALKEGSASVPGISGRIVAHTVGRYIGGTSLYDEVRRLESYGLVLRRGQGWGSELELSAEGSER